MSSWWSRLHPGDTTPLKGSSAPASFCAGKKDWGLNKGYKIGIYRPVPIVTTGILLFCRKHSSTTFLINLQALDFLQDILQEIHLHMMDFAVYDCCSGYPTGSH